MTGRISSLAVCALILAACSQADTTTVAGTDQTNPPTSSTTAPISSTSTPATTRSTSTSTTSTTTTVFPTATHDPLGRGLPRDFLLLDAEGLWHVAGKGTFTLLATGPIQTAFDDRSGGLVLQESPYSGAAFPSIYRVRIGSTETEEIVRPGEEEIVNLEGVVVFGGVPTMLYTSRTWFNNPSTAREVLVAFNLETGEKSAIATTGGWESGVSRASVGGDVFAIEASGEGYSWLNFLDRYGLPLDYPTNPMSDLEECFDTFECPTGSVLSPDGLTLAFARIPAGGDPELVILFLGSGAESSYPIPEFPFWLDYDGAVIAGYLASAWDEVTLDTAVYELTDAGLVDHGVLPGWATIARSDVRLGGVVELPPAG